jgi:Family of unknown function (DUF5317)
MLVYPIAIVLAILIVPLTGGKFRQLGNIRLKRVYLLFGGLALQILVEVIDLPRARFDDVGLAILLASYVLIIGFGLSNLLLTGMGVITIGIAMNAFVIALNQGMPYRAVDGEKQETTVKHRPERDDDVLPQLGDYIAIGSPIDASMSFGDLVIAVGLVDLTFRASRRPRRSRTRTRTAEGDLDGNADDVIDLEAADHSTAERAATSDSGRDLRVGAAHSFERVEHARVVDVARP